jgi:dihydrofolate synthase / folylpolyglutamate synthase
MNYKDALAFLNQFTNYERELNYPYNGLAMNLRRVRAMLHALGDPDRGMRIAHVGGTKGKGSTAVMIEAIARSQGYVTGLFTSPHLLDLRERIRINNALIGEDVMARLTERLPAAAQLVAAEPDLGAISFFEVLTVLGLLAFADAKVDLAVLEVGLGGRFDATTVVGPTVSVLTHISLDHMDILGADLASIAGEKSFIIKPGVPAVIAPQPEEAYAVFSRRCREVGAREVRAAQQYRWRLLSHAVTGMTADFSGTRELKAVKVPLVGAHQLNNVITALAAVDELSASGLAIGDRAVRDGLGSLYWPARFERVAEGPDLILDGAHNAHSAACLREALDELYPGRRILAVIGLSSDKDIEGFVRELEPCLHAAVITRSHRSRAADPARVAQAFSAAPVRLHQIPNVADAMKTVLQLARPQDVILVTGSFYVISEVMEWRRGPA